MSDNVSAPLDLEAIEARLAASKDCEAAGFDDCCCCDADEVEQLIARIRADAERIAALEAEADLRRTYVLELERMVMDFRNR